MATFTTSVAIDMRFLWVNTLSSGDGPTGVTVASVLQTDAGVFRYELSNGFQIRYTGTGFTYSGSTATGGAYNLIEVLDSTGASVLATLNGFGTRALADTYVELVFQPTPLSGIDTINGSTGNDLLLGGLAGDTLNGGDGDDILGGSFGGDTLNGGNGTDIASYRNFFFDGLLVSLENPAINTGVARNDTYTSVEGIHGSGFADELIGNAGDNLLRGFDGVDDLKGRDGNDNLAGGTGIDIVRGEGGDDTIFFEPQDWFVDGGTGRDTAINNDQTPNPVAFGIDIGARNFERYFGSVASEYIFTSVANVYVEIDGRGGADFIVGSDHGDSLAGGAGNDALFGGQGADVLGGDGGSDRLRGGLGGDFLLGEGDADSFVYATVLEGGDTIGDFETVALFGANADRIEIQRAGFDGTLELGTLDAGRFALNAPTSGLGQFVFDTTARTLAWDADGTGGGAAVVLATLPNVASLTSFDIFVV